MIYWLDVLVNQLVVSNTSIFLFGCKLDADFINRLHYFKIKTSLFPKFS